MSKMKLLQDVADDMRALADSIQVLVNAMSQGQPLDQDTEPVVVNKEVEEPEVAQTAVSLEEVRAVLAEKSHDGKMDGVRDLLRKYGATKLSEVNPKDYATLLKEGEVL